MSATSRVDTWDTWFPRVGRLIAFLLGLAIIGTEFGIEHSAHLVAYGVGMLLLGVPVTGWVENLVSRAGPEGWPLAPSRSTPSGEASSAAPATPIEPPEK